MDRARPRASCKCNRMSSNKNWEATFLLVAQAAADNVPRGLLTIAISIRSLSQKRKSVAYDAARSLSAVHEIEDFIAAANNGADDN
eukprot:6213938-Pleurochrysis_carterae.AAC.5